METFWETSQGLQWLTQERGNRATGQPTSCLFLCFEVCSGRMLNRETPFSCTSQVQSCSSAVYRDTHRHSILHPIFFFDLLAMSFSRKAPAALHKELPTFSSQLLHHVHHLHIHHLLIYNHLHPYIRDLPQIGIPIHPFHSFSRLWPAVAAWPGDPAAALGGRSRGHVGHVRCRDLWVLSGSHRLRC